eukprot:16017293-Heterocapsa_arctica.AAC.1
MATMIMVEELMNAEEKRDCRPYRLLWMLLQDECSGGSHNERHQRGDHTGNRRLEAQPLLGTGEYRAEDRAHLLFPGNQTDAEENAELIRSCQTVEDRSKEHYLDEEEGLQFLCNRECKE